MNEKFLTPEELILELKINAESLDRMRRRGCPFYAPLPRTFRYKLSEVLAWTRQNAAALTIAARGEEADE